MKRLVELSTHHPSERELELMLREPLGDPQLRLHFLDTEAGLEGQAIEPGPGRNVRVIHRDAIPAVAIVHDTQLDDDPELLTAASAVALLAAENARLDARWNGALQELRDSRARIVRAGDAERRKVEQNLHDGVQQRLIAIRIDLGLACDAVAADSPTRGRLHAIGDDVETALEELREVAHGLYPPTLADWGIVTALERIRVQSGASLTIEAADLGRYSPALETAVYYSCLESIQNASKHGGPAVAITVGLRQRGDLVTFRVSDNGPGFDPARVRNGAGLQGMRDRLGALEGRVSIVTAAGRGTTIAGSVPVHATTTTSPEALAQDTP
jgi:signal transduction histidine kinase